ncbi:uncharacterized protein LOC106079009 [Biomphalaria glabrata]|uniref:Uncharacterized protein LOC106079009 n=1 Tax=Biomphalaria glabrata TaxID=6526 RepID=A0A9U8EN34_BIOGL|nr:uncharacterized protein LOC106079009 [Biomphalaria glabrata]XP_013095574.2 uncharacterized protein LOC106079009 [Biomphalaria glabrata]XP_013095582.2 uncharacterized protein LOC106079009 [Biomphalaria glabrata]XP_013095590.2 uncharacterized protein LOC106079009 [Biomphalaria glabrata]XP_055888841.1 uncharacterized protein LOC106079009 [Biomphalaria glabrata]
MAETAVMESATTHQHLSGDGDSTMLCGEFLSSPTSSRLYPAQPAVSQSWCQRKSSSQTMFMEGFNDCAVEVMRYLKEVEGIEDNNPMLTDLQGHLTQVKKVFCQESILDEETLGEDGVYDMTCHENLNTSVVESRVHHSSVSMDSMLGQVACTLSPIPSRSVNSSVSDATSIESDMLSSHPSLSNIHCQSLTSDLSASLSNYNHDILLDSVRHDDVFHQCQNSPCISSSSVPSLKQLASDILRESSHRVSVHQCHHHMEQFQPFSYFSCGDGLMSSRPLHLVEPIGQSSPVLPVSLSNYNLFGHLSHGSTQNVLQHTLEPISPLTINTNVQLNSEPVPQSCDGNMYNSLNLKQSQGPEFTKVLTQNVHSVLEQRASMLSGIDTSIVASGELADVLMAVETCRYHDDSRIRAIADEIFHLIQEDYSDDEFEDSFEDDNGEPNRNDESGIEMMDESLDWGNPDLIEQ